MEHLHLEVFVNQTNRVSIRQIGELDHSIVVIPLDQIKSVIKALRECEKEIKWIEKNDAIMGGEE